MTGTGLVAAVGLRPTTMKPSTLKYSYSHLTFYFKFCFKFLNDQVLNPCVFGRILAVLACVLSYTVTVLTTCVYRLIYSDWLSKVFYLNL